MVIYVCLSVVCPIITQELLDLDLPFFLGGGGNLGDTREYFKLGFEILS